MGLSAVASMLLLLLVSVKAWSLDSSSELMHWDPSRASIDSGLFTEMSCSFFFLCCNFHFVRIIWEWGVKSQ